MVFRSSITNTRRFFQKTLENFKSFFSNGYQKLPKSPNDTSITTKPCKDLTFYNNNSKAHNPNIIIPSSPSPPSSSSSLRNKQLLAKPRTPATPKQQGRPDHEQKTLYSKPKIQIVREKLKELETVIGVMTDTDHVSDVQEFLHYYSRLRCPAYIDIVEQFFMEMYSEFFLVPQLEPPITAVHSRRRKTVVGSSRR
ncbi:PREDICTED: uncharacterized protein LOC104804590 [Tarenaya hassleriana]|uniref:uncharacterized protein LOC104804590 n=1 Tax=Tarenaya hassleriana TaxID=28532 RepID=UPI00053C1A38|nr:PREDICTED: uncharacterized protein LOC104804590 [Tarenaya hassleriana]